MFRRSSVLAFGELLVFNVSLNQSANGAADEFNDQSSSSKSSVSAVAAAVFASEPEMTFVLT